MGDVIDVAIREAVEAIQESVESGGTTQTQLAAIQTALQLIDNCISGSEAQVDVVGALPAGTNAIGKVGHDVTGGASFTQKTTTAGTPVRLVGAATGAKYCDVQAVPANTKRICVGMDNSIDETAATVRGDILHPGESKRYPTDPYNLWVDPQVSTEGVTGNYYT